MDTAGELASRHGTAGAFSNGVLATILATPCTAPFLGVALGFAFAQPTPIIVLMFLTVGAGLAAPYVVLSWQPAWLKFLPRPGAWMEKFKIAMGFPMLATAVWLLSLTTTFYGERSWWLGIFLVLVGTAAWVFGTFVQRGTRRRSLAAVITVLLLVAGYAWALDAKLDWRSPVKNSPDTPSVTSTADSKNQSTPAAPLSSLTAPSSNTVRGSGMIPPGGACGPGPAFRKTVLSPPGIVPSRTFVLDWPD